MHKKGFVIGGVLIVATLAAVVFGGGVFAAQTCTTDSTTGVVTCTNSVTASVTVGIGACTFERSDGSGTYNGVLANGATPISVNGSTFETKCNDGGGSSIYAIGYSNDQLGVTDLISSLGSDSNIHTGVYDSTASTHDSSWAMKMQTGTGGYSGAVADFGDFADFQEVPDSYTLVASYPSSTLDPTGVVTAGGRIQAVYQAYASYTQPAGTYVGQVKYTMVHPNSVDVPTLNDMVYMQDLANLTSTDVANIVDNMTTGTSYTLKDVRDDTSYNIAKLGDGNVWMISNLAIAAGTALTSASSNISTGYTIPTADLTSGDSYTEGRTHNDGTTWYNYCAVSAGTVCDDTTTTVTEYDICPAGWRLPTSTEQSGIIGYATTAGLVIGGYYTGGVLTDPSSGYWWSATGSSATNRSVLTYDGSALTATSLEKSSGAFVRCILKIPSGS